MENRREVKDQYISEIEQLLKSGHNALELIEASPICTKVVDLDFNLKYMSSAGVVELNLEDISEYIGKPYPLYFYPDSFRRQMTASLTRVKNEGVVLAQEGAVSDINGGVHHYLSTLVPMKNDDGTMSSIMIVSTNITAQKQAEEELKRTLSGLEQKIESHTADLKKSEQRFAAAMRAANDGMWDWDLHTDDVYYSPRWKGMLGYAEDELEDHLATFTQLVAADEKDSVLTQARNYIEGRADSFEAEMTMRHKEGHDIIVLSRGFLVRSKVDGQPLRLIGTHEDITQRKKSEQFILDTSKILKMIALRQDKETIYDAIAHLYESRHPGMRCSMLILEGNTLLHAGAPSLPKEYCDAVNGLENGPEVGSCGTATYLGVRVIAENIETDPKWAKIKDAALPHGMRCCWSEPIKNSQGEVLGAFGMYYDYPARPNEMESKDLESAAQLAGIIMEREKSEKELELHRKHLEKLVSERTRQFETAKLEAEAANTAKGNFLANMSHEIRTPMNALLGLSQLALRTDLNPVQQDYLQKINTSAESLLGIVNDILDFSKIEAGMLKVENISFNVRDTLQQVMHVFQQAADEKELELELQISADVPNQLLGDPLRLRQILTNIVGNGVKFTDQGTVAVHVGVSQKKDQDVTLKIEVTDTGIGMTPQQQKSAFAPFDQADTSTTREYGGTGLGLSISKHLIELMGGDISVESKINGGSCFVFTIVCWDDIQYKEQVAEPPKEQIPDFTGKHVLLAEDNLINQDVAVGILELSGCKITIAGNGQEAIDIATSDTSIDLILMDLQMPVKNGLDATKELRKREKDGKRIPIIAMTGAAMNADRIHVFESGMDAFVTKPFSIEGLYSEMRKWLMN